MITSREGEEINPEEALRRHYLETQYVLTLHNEYRGLIKKLVEKDVLRGFITHKFLTLHRAHPSEIYSKFGYLYGDDLEVKNDALILLFKGILYCSVLPIGNGLNPIYKLFRDFSDSRRYEFKHSGDLSNPFSVA